MDIAAALSRLDPWFEHLHGIVHHGFEQYRAYSPGVLIEHDARATAACIYIHMWREAERRFAEGARSVAATVEVRGLSLVALGDFALIRFKKWMKMGTPGIIRHLKQKRSTPRKSSKVYRLLLSDCR